MAPARSSTRRGAQPAVSAHHPTAPDIVDGEQNVNKQLFLDPMLGSPLSMYVEKEVEDKELICQLIVKHGGTVAQGYSRVPYILVDPHKASGQNLYRQYAGKEGKIVLHARWVLECVKANHLQTFHTNWGGCKVTGTETVYPLRQPEDPPANAAPRHIPPTVVPQTLPPAMPPVEQMQAYQFQIYPPQMHPQPPHPPRNLTAGPPPTWHMVGPAPPPAPMQAGSAPQHMLQRPPIPPPQTQQQPPEQAYRDGTWDGYNAPDGIAAQQGPYEYPRYREDQNAWGAPGPYYETVYEQGYSQPPFMEEEPDQSSGSNSVSGQQPMSVAGPSTQPANAEAEKPRGRKRTRPQPAPAVPASALVVSRNPPARSPTPPTRVIKSTYGGNLFTADDVLYLKKYIDYCQDQCLVLSLREICERIAVKAPHHTFYSWRRYCNKHQIKLGGYTMTQDRSMSPEGDDQMGMDIDENGPPPSTSRVTGGAHAGARLDMSAAKDGAKNMPHRTRSPSPPRSLFRSTTGKGVAFTQEDVNFLMKFMTYRKSQGNWDVVAFWRDVAIKAPHHSRASWMKFWRRHKHELDWEAGDAPLPAPPDKKLRYSKEDDILLAKYFYHKPDGTSDKIFQAFGRLNPHHPWKGWQEHHRIHRAKIDQLITRMANGENLDPSNVDDS